MKTSRNALKKRIALLEEATKKHKQELLLRHCNCREVTWYHTSDELKAILDNEAIMPCSVHGIRNLGKLKWQFCNLIDLLPEDSKYCSCLANGEGEFKFEIPGEPTPPGVEGFNAVMEYLNREFQEERRRCESLESGYYAWLRERMDQQNRERNDDEKRPKCNKGEITPLPANKG